MATPQAHLLNAHSDALIKYLAGAAPPLTPPLTPLHEGRAQETASSFFEIPIKTTTSDFLNIPVQSTAAPEPLVAVIGTGYVGLHLVEAFAQAYNVIAFDVSAERIQEVEKLVEGEPVSCTTNPADLSNATHFLIAVSTIVDSQHRIDTSYIEKAIETIRNHARPGSTIVIESSIAVGMTRELLTPLMESKSFKCGMSPERVDPGRTYPHYTSIPKLISGIDSDSMSSIQDLYGKIFRDLVPVSCPEVAEMTKLYENCQRMMCIAYANEMADACAQLSVQLSNKAADQSKGVSVNSTNVHIDPWEVSRAAATKPFGHMTYSPSLGVGGHCIPVNPYYLLSNSDFPLLKACTQSMQDRPARIGDSIMAKLNDAGRTDRPRILVVGIGFKRGQSVLSNSPGLALATHLLSSYDVYVEFADPLVVQAMVPGVPKLDDDMAWTVDNLNQFDSIVIAVNQPGLDLEVVKEADKHGTAVEWYCNL